VASVYSGFQTLVTALFCG